MPCMVNARGEHRETQGHQRPGTTKPTKYTELSSRYLGLDYNNSRKLCHYVMPVLFACRSGQDYLYGSEDKCRLRSRPLSQIRTSALSLHFLGVGQ